MADLMQFVPPGLRGPLRDVMGMGRVTAEGGAGLINAVRSNPMAVNKAIGESMIGAIADPVGTAKDVYQDVADAATGALTKTAADYLMDMYGIEPAEASPTQLRAANDARYADLAATAAAVVPGGKALKTLGKAAGDVDVGGLAADATYAGRSIAEGDFKGVLEAFERGGEGQDLSAAKVDNRVAVAGVPPAYIDQLEAGIGLRDSNGRINVDSLLALASQFDEKGNRRSNIKPDRKTGMTHNHPASNVRMNTPIEEQNVERITRGKAAKRKNTDFKVGDVLISAFGDRAAADVDIGGFGGETLSSPVSLFGGGGYMREPNDYIWASDEGVTSPLLRQIMYAADEGKNPKMVYTSMGAQAGDFATDNLLRDYIRNIDIDPSLRGVLAERLAKSKDFTDKNFPMDDLVSGGNSRRNSIGLLDGVEEYFDNLNGSNRRAIWQAMDNATFRDAGIPVGEARIAMTDPDLLYANPFDSGLNVGRPDLSSREISMTSDHPIYPTAIRGQYEGSTPVQIPGSILWRDFFNARRGEGGGLPGSDQRSFLMSHPNMRQEVDRQMEDEIGQFIEFWRAFNQ